MFCDCTRIYYIILHVLVFRQHNGDDPPQDWEIGASGCIYYKEICYDARSHERKTLVVVGVVK